MVFGHVWKWADVVCGASRTMREELGHDVLEHRKMDHVGSDGIHREELLSVRRDPPWAVGTMAHLHAHVLFAISEGGIRHLMAVFRYGGLVCGSFLGGRRTAGVGYGLCAHSGHDCQASMSNRAPNPKNAAPKHAN